MQIWPAIDLRGGKCVRLVQGDYRRELVFDDDPAAVARRLVEQGAQFLHLVDLDGARAGRPLNLESIAAIVGAVKDCERMGTGSEPASAGAAEDGGCEAPVPILSPLRSIPCELGGGIRDEATIEQLLQLGLSRLVIGTRALRDPDWLRTCAARWPGRLVLGIDARDGQVATDGWLQTSSAAAEDLARQFDDAPLAAIIYTDIATDGMLAGPNLPAMRRMREAIRLPLIASGGVTTAADVAALAAIGVAGCIIGRALYENRITLPAALAAASQANKQTIARGD